MATISIIVPMYNVAGYIATCCESIRKYWREGLQVVLVDDGSTDGSMAIASQALAGLNVITVTQTNQGVSVARNKAMQAATGDYLLFLDSDDFLLSVPHIDGLADIYTGDYLFWDGTNLTTPNNLSWNATRRYLVKRELITTHNLWFIPDLSCGEDITWCAELLQLPNTRKASLDAPFYAYTYKRQGSLSTQLSVTSMTDLLNAITMALAKHPSMKRQLYTIAFLYINAYWQFNASDRRTIRYAYRQIFPWLCHFLYPVSLGLYICKRLRQKYQSLSPSTTPPPISTGV